MIKAVIFDCFGVLVGSGFKETYRQAGGDPVVDNAFIEDTLNTANLGLISSGEMNQRIIDKIGISYDRWKSTVAKTEQPKEELLAYVKRLRHDGYKVAILSNANIGTLQRKFTTEQLAIFDAVVVSAEVGFIKPDAAIYKYTAEQVGVKPEECVFIDDSKGYCEAARAVGMQAICYQDFEQMKRDLEALLRAS